ncbi:MAG: hypothetical protein ACRD2W_02385 [Acidimicrobiales bacterium]
MAAEGYDGMLTSDADRNANTITQAYPTGGGYPTTLTGNAGSGSGKTLNIAYGAPAGKLSSLSRTADGETASVGYEYDAEGLLWKVTDPEQGVTTFEYEADNRIKTITDRANHITRFTYDGAGRVETVTREISTGNAVTRYDYSTPGHTKVTDPNLNPPTDFSFAAVGAMTDALDARNSWTHLTWNSDLLVTQVDTGVAVRWRCCSRTCSSSLGRPGT